MMLFRRLARKLHGPRCHVTPEEKLWVEDRMVWLKAQFGAEPVRRTPLDPTSALLPKRWDGSYKAGADLFNALCGFMLVDPARLDLHFYSAGETGPAGLFYSRAAELNPLPKHVIALDEGDLQQPALLAATICHELAHVHLLDDRRLELEKGDGEPLTDLLTVYFGAGILMANSVFQFSQWQSGLTGGWSWGKRGYLSEHLYGMPWPPSPGTAVMSKPIGVSTCVRMLSATSAMPCTFWRPPLTLRSRLTARNFVAHHK